MTDMTTESLCIDACYNSLIKKNEELCGDRVEVINTPESTLLVLSDGLGSGVKANILSTLTSKIISTMISRGASIEDTVDTIAHTLPVCKLRGIAYSTFMILHICKDGKGYIVEYDNPPCMLIRDGRHIPFDYEEKTIEGKLVRESRFTAKPGDYFVIVSDGVTQAGMGETLAFGWGCEEVAEFLCGPCGEKLSAPRVVWTGITGDTEKLCALARAADNLAARRGVAKERKKFSPHITLGRRSETMPLTSDALRELTFDEISLPSWAVREVIFMRSKLTPKGPIYTPLKIYEL